MYFFPMSSMNMPRFLAAVAFVLSLFAPHTFAGLAEDLASGQHILLMRHADAPGVGDPPGYRLDDCNTQRNLGDKGKREAAQVGAWLAKQGVTSALVLSSAWCRCQDTARLLDKGPVKVEKALGSFFGDMSQQRAQTAALTELVRSTLAANPRKPVILVTHHVNIEAYTGKVLGAGDLVLVKVDRAGRPASHSVYPLSAIASQ
jgi:phosphohistidine phosphatase SixA